MKRRRTLTWSEHALRWGILAALAVLFICAVVMAYRAVT